MNENEMFYREDLIAEVRHNLSKMLMNPDFIPRLHALGRAFGEGDEPEAAHARVHIDIGAGREYPWRWDGSDSIKPPTEVFDWEVNKTVPYKVSLNRGIVKYTSEKVYEMGYFSPNPFKNVVVLFKGAPLYTISLDIFPPKTIMYDNHDGLYRLTTPKGYDEMERCYMQERGRGRFPYYSIRRRYDAESSLHIMHPIKENDKYYKNPDVLKLLGGTFGIEFESNGGYIPEHECFRNGLIPLRDGSISGIEYATNIMSPTAEGFSQLRRQCDSLHKYTGYDKECSLHIHFGGYPMLKDPRFIFALYYTGVKLQNALSGYLPEYTFKTSLYKNSGKDYCNALPMLQSFGEVYSFLSEGTSFLGSLTAPHPNDSRHEAKWNVHSRYYWMNLINLCFYKSPKTIEFRFLRPSHNYNKIVNWIFIMNAIILFAQKVVEECDTTPDSPNMHLSQCIRLKLAGQVNPIKCVLMEVYPRKVVESLMNFLTILKANVHYQESCDDKIGVLDEIDDTTITTNVLELTHV